MKTKTKARSPKHSLNPSEWNREYRDYLIRFALQRISDHGLAEDLVQESYLSAGNARNSFRGEGPATPWLENRANDRDTFDPDTATQRAEMMTLLDEAVDRLPESMGKAYRMREIQGRSTEEITKTLNITKGNLWVLIHRAKQALKEQLHSAWAGTDFGMGTGAGMGA